MSMSLKGAHDRGVKLNRRRLFRPAVLNVQRIATMIVLAVVLAACNDRTSFRVEPTNHKTFAPTRLLRAGEVVQLHVLGLAATQRLHFYRCGPRCNSATIVGTWDGSRIPSDARVMAEVPSDGEYYFWVEEVSGKSATALVARGSELRQEGFIVYYGALKIVVEDVHASSGRTRAREPF